MLKDNEIIDYNTSNAVLAEKLKNIAANSINHEKEDERRFDSMLKFTEDSFKKIEKQIDALDEKLSDKVDSLWDLKNKQEGAFGLSKWFVGGVGGLFAVIIGHFLR